jgi:large subunit ribosomal protein L5
MGIQEQTAFPEVEPAKIEYQQGMDITFVTSAETNEEAHRMLSLLGMPFKKPGAKD